ncbi:MAG: hypothetical protein ETSY2_14115 [Candidatus Entotheonella gemina]|uniref:Amidohydrolase-related domain-containing protein n=1 Tax=Candidatus Entotheonella gemina TaxID=1429439 RepID=W4M9U9_9BACT|nr:MAG: hypothetical protein ETSY2_14115 [Candidatus Entotheonella gemina]
MQLVPLFPKMRHGPTLSLEHLAREALNRRPILLTLIMGGEIYLPGYEKAWQLGRELELPIAAHVLGNFGIPKVFDQLAQARQMGPDNLFIHMTGMSDAAWKVVADNGVAVSIAVPIEMTMRHGMPPILKAMELGVRPSLSTDVECTMTADFFEAAGVKRDLFRT